MNAQASRKLIVVGAMAVVVAIGVTTFAMRPHTVTQIAQTTSPPVPLADSTVAEDAVPTNPVPPSSAPAPIAPIVAAPVTPVQKAVVVIKRATAEPKVAARRSVHASDDTTPTYSDPASSDIVKPAAVVPDLSMTAAAASVARSSEPAPADAATATTPVPAISPVPAPAVVVPAPAVIADQNPVTSPALAVSDSEITANVKSQIAVDTLGQTTSIGVTTTNGVVALTGSLASQTDIDHIKLVVAAVKDVKSVDTSALSLPAT